MVGSHHLVLSANWASRMVWGQLALGANEGMGSMTTLEPPRPGCKRADRRGSLPSHFPTQYPLHHLLTVSITHGAAALGWPSWIRTDAAAGVVSVVKWALVVFIVGARGCPCFLRLRPHFRRGCCRFRLGQLAAGVHGHVSLLVIPGC